MTGNPGLYIYSVPEVGQALRYGAVIGSAPAMMPSEPSLNVSISISLTPKFRFRMESYGKIEGWGLFYSSICCKKIENGISRTEGAGWPEITLYLALLKDMRLVIECMAV